jgi:Ca-activated chloride channel family protein
MTLRDDPVLSAYALGEADDATRADVEARLASDPEAREALAEIRATAVALEEGLRAEPADALPPLARTEVQSHAVATLSRRPASLWRSPGFAIAAALLLGLVGAFAVGRGGGGHGFSREVSIEKAERDAVRTFDGTTDEDGVVAAPRGRVSTADWAVARASEESRESGGRSAESKSRFPGTGTTGTGSPDRFLERPRDAGAPASGLVPAGPLRDGPHFEGPGGNVPPGAREPRDPKPPATTTPPAPGAIGFGGGGDGGRSYFSAHATPGFATSGESARTGDEGYARIAEAAYVVVAQQPLSTFSVDVDTASYANVRRFLEGGRLPPAEAVRVEEMVNYFRYADPPPTGEHPLAVRVEAAACPWALDHRLVRVSLSTKEIERQARPAMNLVFLIDVSGSMDSPDKLPLVKASMRMLLDELNERDRVAIVTYAGESGVRLPPTSCERKKEIMEAVDGLSAGGSTNGASGIRLAYDAARTAYLVGGVNRVILCTDGDFNVGVTSHEDLLALITEKARSGTFLTVLGYGTGNLKDDRLEMLADKGNGAYGYVDSTKEAHRILVEQAGGTLVTVAKDVKIQVEFNPAVVAAYRLVGYENRLLATKDFTDDAKDAGEVGAGHRVTALYEVVPVGKPLPGTTPPPAEPPLKYGPAPAAPPAAPAPPPAPAAGVAGETLTVKVRYKKPDEAASVPMEVALTDSGASYGAASADFKFAAAVAAFGQILRGSASRGTASLDGVLELAGEGLAFDPDGRRKEFVELVAKAKGLGAK